MILIFPLSDLTSLSMSISRSTHVAVNGILLLLLLLFMAEHRIHFEKHLLIG